MNVSHIIMKFGGVRPLARLLGYPPSTVQNWETRGTIPAKHQQPILDIGVKHKIDITPNDFFSSAKKARQ